MSVVSALGVVGLSLWLTMNREVPEGPEGFRVTEVHYLDTQRHG